MASVASKPKARDEHKLRATAIQHATMIEEKKQLRNQITDLVVECFDLPTQPLSSPTNASAKDIALFKKSLNLFQASDFDDLILERNIDGRCGYTLCPNANRRAPHEGKHVWSKEAGFFIDRADYERWCSRQCKDRGFFVRVQLSTEPAWLREGKSVDVKLLDEMTQRDDMSEAVKELAVADVKDQELANKLKALSLERGNGGTKDQDIQILEKESGKAATAPFQHGSRDLIEGLPTRSRTDRTRQG